MTYLRGISEPVKAVILAATLYVAYHLLGQLLTLFVLVIVTLIVSIALSAAAGRLEHRGLPRPAGTLLTLLAGLAVVALLVVLVVLPFFSELKRLADALPTIVSDLESRAGDATGVGKNEVGERLQDGLQGFIDRPGKLLGPLAAFGLNVAGLLGTVVLILMAAFYIAVNPRPLVDGALSLFPSERHARVCEVMCDIRTAWIGWLRGVLIDMAVTGILLYVGLLAIGMDYALVFAMISALLVVVPYVGAILGGVPPVLFGLAESPGKALAAFGVYVLVQQIEGNVIIPVVMARAVDLHPAVVLVGVLVVGRLFGFVGLFVAVPVISMTIILVRELWVRPLHSAERPAVTLPP